MRLIDADYFDKMLIDAQAKCAGRNSTFKFGFLSTVRANLERCPSVDAVPVRRGRWIPHITEDGYKSGYDCSVCGVWLIMPNGLRKYCCDCGALMDGGEKDG